MGFFLSATRLSGTQTGGALCAYRRVSSVLKKENVRTVLFKLTYHAHRLSSLNGETICFDWSASSCLLSGFVFALNLVSSLVSAFNASIRDS